MFTPWHGIWTEIIHSFEKRTECLTKTSFMEHSCPCSSSSEMSHQLQNDCVFNWNSVCLEDVQIVDKEACWFKWGVKETIYIRQQEPVQNCDGGCHQLWLSSDNIIKSRVFQQRKWCCADEVSSLRQKPQVILAFKLSFLQSRPIMTNA